MKIKTITQIFTVTVALMLSSAVYAENIDPNEDGSQYSYGENVGWINFDPTCGGVTIDADGDFSGWACASFAHAVNNSFLKRRR